MPALSVVIPCFNEADGLPELVRRLTAVCRDAVDSFEIVLVNDGSRDATWQVMNDQAAGHPELVLVDLARNHGHQLALTAGLSLARGERILVIDADLQDPPELLPDMMAVMDREGADVVYGQRIQREGETWFKKVTAKAFYRLLDRLTDVPIPVDTGDFRLMTRRVNEALLAMPESHRFIRGMVSWVGYRQVAFPYHRAARHAGETKYTLGKMVNFALDALTGFSIRPLRMALHVAFPIAGLAALMVLWVLYQWLVEDTVQGWASLMVAVLLLSAVQMFFLGIIGEYVGRAFMEAKRRPLFLIREVVRREDPAD